MSKKFKWVQSLWHMTALSIAPFKQTKDKMKMTLFRTLEKLNNRMYVQDWIKIKLDLLSLPTLETLIAHISPTSMYRMINLYRELSCLVASRGDTRDSPLCSQNIALGFIVNKAAMSWDLIWVHENICHWKLVFESFTSFFCRKRLTWYRYTMNQVLDYLFKYFQGWVR